MICFVLAATKDGIIGKNQKLPWNIPEDLKIFQKLTLNKIILMGRKTYDSIGSKPLPKRLNIVISRQKFNNYKSDNLIITSDYGRYIEKYANNKKNNLYVIGGSKIFELFLNSCNFIYLNIIKKKYNGDVRINLPNLLKNFVLEYKIEHLDFFECKYARKKD